jgi:TRAP-type C4-dicarboxylate transport system permease small subunit
MHILANVLFMTAIVAALAALGTAFYVVIFGWKYASPRDHQNADWMVVPWRRYKVHLIAYFGLIAVFLTTILLGFIVDRHAP